MVPGAGKGWEVVSSYPWPREPATLLEGGAAMKKRSVGAKGSEHQRGQRVLKGAGGQLLSGDDLKATWQRAIVLCLRREWGVHQLRGPIALACTFVELDDGRGPGDVAMGSVKLILDALVAGEWLPTVGVAHVGQLGPFCFQSGNEGPTDPLPPAVIVMVREMGGRISVAVLPMRLPGWTELHRR